MNKGSNYIAIAILGILLVVMTVSSIAASNFYISKHHRFTSGLTKFSKCNILSISSDRVLPFPLDTIDCNLSCPPIARDDFDSVLVNAVLKVSIPRIGLNDTYYAPVRYTAVSKARTVQGGELTIDATGAYTYTPPKDFIGTDVFKYTVCNTKGKPGCGTALLSIKVYAEKINPPLAVNDSFKVKEKNEFTGNVLQNDVNSSLAKTRIISTNARTKGKVELDTAGNFNYLPAQIYVERDTFYYSLCNASGSCSIASVAIQIEAEEPAVALKIPNGFTPNKDGVNDFFEIVNIENYPLNHIKVFNRWGNLVYDAKGYNNKEVRWEGNSSSSAAPGDRLPEGTYFFVISPGGGHEDYTGYVMIMR